MAASRRDVANHLVRRLYRLLPRGKTRLLPLALRMLGGETFARCTHGRMLLDLDSYIDALTFLTGAYEAVLSDVLIREAKKVAATMFVDVGANIGTFSLALAPHVPDVVAFEPDRRHFHHLAANVYLNGLDDKIQLHNVALSSATGHGCLRDPAARDFAKHNNGMYSLEGSGAPRAIVQTARLDSILQIRGENVLIKIDVEGHELAALDGMTDILAQNRCVLLIEALGNRWPAVRDKLGPLGYSLAASLPESNYLLRFSPDPLTAHLTTG